MKKPQELEPDGKLFLEQVSCILTRFQGHQVKYLLEIALKKCIIEPVYARDISDLFN